MLHFTKCRQVREETQRRIEVSENFQKTMDELGTLMTAHSQTNSKLKDENGIMNKQVWLGGSNPAGKTKNESKHIFVNRADSPWLRI